MILKNIPYSLRAGVPRHMCDLRCPITPLPIIAWLIIICKRFILNIFANNCCVTLLLLYNNYINQATRDNKMIRMYYAVKPNNEKVFFHARDLMGARQFALTLGFIPLSIEVA